MAKEYIESREVRKTDKFDTEFLDKTPFVNQVEKCYRVNVISQPEIIRQKEHLFLDEKIVVVGVDVIRCATTASAVLAAGAQALRFYGKRHELIEKLFIDFDRYTQRGLLCATMGEFAGKPMPGGIAANSPKAVSAELVKEKRILFLTKNLGNLCCDVIDIIEKNRTNWQGDFVIGCLFNLERVAKFIRSFGKVRIVFCCGGFRKTESLEDLFFTGKVIKKLEIPEKDCDDAALSAIAVYEKYRTVKKLYTAVKHCRVAQVLSNFGMADDIESSLMGTYIDSAIFRSMKKILPMLNWENGDAWFFPQ